MAENLIENGKIANLLEVENAKNVKSVIGYASTWLEIEMINLKILLWIHCQKPFKPLPNNEQNGLNAWGAAKYANKQAQNEWNNVLFLPVFQYSNWRNRKIGRKRVECELLAPHNA